MTKKISNILFSIGFIFIIISSILGIRYYLNTQINNQNIIDKLYTMMPNIQNGIILDSLSSEMPIVEIENENFVGIIEIPKFNRTLPLYASWDTNKINNYPCTYLGNVYDGSMIIGGSDIKNQFDFMKIINEEDALFIIDMKGKKYSYHIDQIEITKDVSTNHLISNEHELILFVKNTYSMDYTILRCKY